MNVIINGNREDIPDGLTISDLVKSYNLAPSRIAIELNLKILPKRSYDITEIKDGDKIEIVHFVGGG